VTARLSWAEKLRRYRQDKANEYAQAILSAPAKKPLYSTLLGMGIDTTTTFTSVTQ